MVPMTDVCAPLSALYYLSTGSRSRSSARRVSAKSVDGHRPSSVDDELICELDLGGVWRQAHCSA